MKRAKKKATKVIEKVDKAGHSKRKEKVLIKSLSVIKSWRFGTIS